MTISLKQYLSEKYGVKKPSTMTSSEARAFGVPYPLRNGWLQEHGDKKMSLYCAEELFARLHKRLNKQLAIDKETVHYTEKAIDILRRNFGFSLETV
ncbi:MAG: hypothetical protein V4447_10815 [Pseudomonadota bacterium]